MDAMASELTTLTEYLGDHHDRSVLQQTLTEFANGNDKPEAFELMQGLIAERERELRIAAVELGARIYGEKPHLYCARLRVYWRTWRHQKVGTSISLKLSK